MKPVSLILVFIPFLACHLPAGSRKVNQLVDSYLGGSPTEQLKAKDEILALGDDATKTVLARYESADLNAQRKLTVLLGGIGEPRQTVIDKLNSAAKSSEPGLREAAALALGKIEPPDKTVAATLTSLLQDEESEVRAAAANAIGSQGQLASPSVPLLSKLALEKDPYVSNAALLSLIRLDPAEANLVAKKITWRVIQRLENDHPEIRVGAAFIIAQLTTLHKSAETTMITRLSREPIPVVRAQMASTLLRINSKDALRAAHPALVDLMQGPDVEAKKVSQQAFLYLMSTHPEAFPKAQAK